MTATRVLLDDEPIAFQKKELKGSRLRCLMLTSLPNHRVAEFLTGLVQPHATVEPTDKWMPSGFLKPAEAKLGETPGFLPAEHRRTVTAWWLAVARGANMPNWDIASTCRVGGKPGLLLVEAKAHVGELSRYGKKKPDTANGWKNHERIKDVIKEACDGLNQASGVPGWSLSRDSHYQLSNRFAWAWKVASLGVPVVLVYLGFLATVDMEGSRRIILTTEQQWRDCLLIHSRGIVPPEAWNRKLSGDNMLLVTLMRTADVNVSASL